MKLLNFLSCFLLLASFAIAQSTQLTGGALDTGKSELESLSAQNFSLSTVPTSLTMGLGQTLTPAFDVCVTPLNGFSSPITFTVTGQGTGTTITFVPNPYTPPGGNPLAGCIGTVATIVTTGGAATGTFNLIITGTAGALVQTTALTLTVVNSADFSISGPGSLSITQGSTATGSIAITAIGGFASAITFTTSGLPTGVSSGFVPNPATPPGQTSSVMTLTATGSATVGNSTITVTGTAGAIVHSITISLSVLASGGGAPMQYAARTDWCELGNEAYAAQPWGCGTLELAGAGASNGFGTGWTNPSNVTSTSTSNYATVTLPNLASSQGLQATAFPFPALSAAPVALTVSFNYYGGTSGARINVALIKSGTVVGSPQTVQVTGGTAGAPLTAQLVFYAPGFLAADVNNSGSGVNLGVINGSTSNTIGINSVRLLASVAPQGPPMIFLGLPGQLPPSPDGFAPINGQWKDGANCQNVKLGDNCDGVIMFDPDFHENIVRCVDSVSQSNGILMSALGKSFGMGSDGKLQWWSSDSKKLLITNTGSGQAMLTFSADANMFCGPSGIYSNHGGSVALYGVAGQQNLPGTGYAFSPSNPHKLYELMTEAEDSTTPVGCPGTGSCSPVVCSTPGTGNCSYVIQRNTLIINDSGTPDTWSYTRTRDFNLTCVGTNCPAYANPGVQCTVGAGCNSNGLVNGGVDPTGGIDNTGTDSPNCLPYNYSAGGGTGNHGWNGTTQISTDETSFTIGIGDTAQDGLPNRGSCNGASAAACTGSVFVANYRVGKGCRVLNSLGKVIIGDWGPTGAPTNAEQGGLLQDNFVLHEGLSPLNSAIGDFSPVQNPASSTVTGVVCTSGVSCVITTAKISKMLLTETTTFYNMGTTGVTCGGVPCDACLNGGPWLVTSQSTATGPFQFTVTAAAGGTGSCTSFTDNAASGKTSVNGLCPLSGVNGYCNNYYWETANLRVHPVLATAGQGHNASRFQFQYSAKFYTAINPLNTILNICNLPTQTYCPLALQGFPTDQHGSPNNGGTADQTPVFLVSTCGSAVPPACPTTGYGSFWWDEIVALEDYITNSANSGDNFAKNCNYGSGLLTAPCAYRFGHPFATGSSPVFSAANNLGNLDPSGRFIAVSSDWGGTTGCTDGSIPPTCVASSANAIGSIYIYSVLSAHQ